MGRVFDPDRRRRRHGSRRGARAVRGAPPRRPGRPRTRFGSAARALRANGRSRSSGSSRALAGKPYVVLDAQPAPWREGRLQARTREARPRGRTHTAPRSARCLTPGAYRVRVPALGQTSRPLDRPVRAAPATRSTRSSSSSRPTATGTSLADPRPSHLHDATVKGGPHDGERLDLTGGWMDAGDMIHFAQTTSFAAARPRSRRAARPGAGAAARRRGGVGIRWLRQGPPGARPVHRAGRRPARPRRRLPGSGAATMPRSKPGIGHRRAYPGIPAAGSAATSPARRPPRWRSPYDRTRQRGTDLTQAAAVVRGRRGRRPSRTPRFRAASTATRTGRTRWPAARPRSYRSTGEQQLPERRDPLPALPPERADGTLGVVDSFASFAAADICGALGRAGPRTRGRAKLRLRAPAGVRRGRRPAGPRQRLRDAGVLQLGHDCRRTAPAGRSPGWPAAGGLPDGRAVAAGARDYMLGRNPFGAQLRGRLRARRPVHPHHWASVFGDALPRGAVVGGPAPIGQIRRPGLQASTTRYEHLASPAMRTAAPTT